MSVDTGDRIAVVATNAKEAEFNGFKARPLVLKTERQKMLYACYKEAISGNWRAQHQLKREALSTSDFPGFFQQVNNAVMQAGMQTYDPTWTKIAKRIVADSLLPENEMSLDIVNTNLPPQGGGRTRLPASLPRVPELTPFPTVGFTASSSSYRTAKTGVRVEFSWEAFRHDRWGQIRQFPSQLQDLAVNTMETEAWSQYIVSTGWNPSMFPSGHNLAGNPALSLDSISDAIVQASAPPATPADQRPRINPQTSWSLLVPPGLVLRAETLLSARDIEVVEGDTRYRTNNAIAGKIQIVEMPWWSILAPTTSYAATAWALIPSNGNGPYGTTAANVFLSGNETPELRIKSDAGQALGGGELSPYEGSFDEDAIQVRLRFFVGGSTLRNDNTVWSKGTGVASTNPAV